ncbi:MAG: Thrombospondin type 3 repeat [Nocardioides sp.]|nr:Thrombospondin type 3 repeat [Nocardioides sp.]
MRKLLRLLLPAVTAVALVAGAVSFASTAPPTGPYSQSYFGDGNLPPGCVRDMSLDNPANQCFHMRTGLNALDSPKVDVLVLVPASPTAERDMRIMRQSVEMWEGGIEQLARRMKQPWLTEVDFHITVDALSGEFTTYPLVDPEIVVVGTNPVGGIGIGIDPAQFVGDLGIYDASGAPCLGIENPFDFAAWSALPGFDTHHEERSGTYVEDCGGAGGNVCFAINGAIDPLPGTTEVFSLFDLVSHEFGHCLTVGHVGDGAEGSWGPVPTNDIMSYNEDPPGLSKCVSSLDVEGFALRMSGYLDRNRDGKVTAADELEANDLPGDGRNPFQVQSPSDHIYASASGSPADCPQPDVGLVPGERVSWDPTPVATTRPRLTVDRAARVAGGKVRLTGTATYVPRGKQPRRANGSFVDRTGDARSPFNDLRALDVRVTNTQVRATIKVARLAPTSGPAGTSSYSLIVNGRRFDSTGPASDGANTFDNGAEVFLDGVSDWDRAAGTVTFAISRRYLESFGNVAPYYVGSTSSVQNAKRVVLVDDTAPAGQNRIVVTGRRLVQLDGPQQAAPPKGTKPYSVSFRAEDGNRFEVGQTNGGLGSLVSDPHAFSMAVTSPSRVELSLDWSDPVSDLDLTAQPGAGDPVYSSGGKPDTIVLERVQGAIDLEVNPTLVGPTGTTYSLRATVTPIGRDTDRDGLTDPGDACPRVRGPLPSGCPDADRDGVPDRTDRCDLAPAGTATGCPAPAVEWIRVLVDGKPVTKVRLDRELGVGRFDLRVPVPRGTHRIRTVWLGRSGALTSVVRQVR